jgi:hypothetical protein
MAGSRWRVALLTSVLVAAGGCSTVPPTKPPCTPGNRLGILAQAVPSAEYLPCVGPMPAGWDFGRLDVEDGRATFWLDHDRDGVGVAEVELAPSCDTTHAFRSGQVGPAERYVEPGSVSPILAATTYDVFDGGCVTYAYSFTKRDNAEHITLFNQLFDFVELFPRETLEEEVRRDLGQELTPGAP